MKAVRAPIEPSPPGARRKHLRYDQQEPFEEPSDPGLKVVPISLFARAAPTWEDDFFYEEEHGRRAPPLRPETGGPSPRASRDEPLSPLWSRIYQVLTRRFDVSWRP